MNALKLKVAKSIDQDDNSFKKIIIQSLYDNWLFKYAEQKFITTTISYPKVTSTISELPSFSTNQFKSSTEKIALKVAEAKHFIEVFHRCLETLPQDYQRLIKKKFLTVGSDGSWLPDEFIYPELNISRSTYYEWKPKALYLLGLALYQIKQ